MGCSSCSTTSKDGKTAGCNNNGGCATGGCNKMNVFDWLSNMEMPKEDRFDIVEVRFKGGRKEFFRNINALQLTTGDAVVVDVPNGHHIGFVSLQGELVRLQMQKKKVLNNDEIRAIYRLATLKDLEKFEEVKKREHPTLYRTREIARDLKLDMKLTDIEYQADNTKATFFYSAEDRVDFREMIKLLAGEFKIRVEMRQISLRQEAGRLGGIGSCGRELCCSTWLSDFKSVSTGAARYQNLSLNPTKLSGQCGRLKCCLNYELETYMDALQGIPEVEKPLFTEKGNYKLQKTDIFRKIMWFSLDDDTNWYSVDVERVAAIIAMNAAGKKPHSITEDTLDLDGVSTKINSDLEQLDKKFSGKNKKKKKKKPRPGQGQAPSAQQQQPVKSVSARQDVMPKAERDANRPQGEGQARNKNKNRNKNRNRNQGQNLRNNPSNTSDS
jgi:cell fate regulator YaaT (PSP1 superfamily)